MHQQYQNGDDCLSASGIIKILKRIKYENENPNFEQEQSEQQTIQDQIQIQQIEQNNQNKHLQQEETIKSPLIRTKQQTSAQNLNLNFKEIANEKKNLWNNQQVNGQNDIQSDNELLNDQDKIQYVSQESLFTEEENNESQQVNQQSSKELLDHKFENIQENEDQNINQAQQLNELVQQEENKSLENQIDEEAEQNDQSSQNKESGQNENLNEG